MSYQRALRNLYRIVKKLEDKSPSAALAKARELAKVYYPNLSR